MTVASFVIIAAMAATAVTVTVVTGKQAWVLVFGGISVASLIGTLIWRPYDRLFRATILAQQIEMIHVQIIVALRGTLNLADRLRICQDAVAGLQTVFREHAHEGRSDQSSVERRRKRQDA